MALACLALLNSCGSGVSQEPGVPGGECLLLRGNTSSVLGMDVGSSVSLSDGRSMFIFGDTFTGTWDGDGSRHISGTVHSSAAIVDDTAIQSCFANTPFVESSGGVAELLASTRDEAWPIGPVRIDSGHIELAFTWVKSDPNAGLGFDTLGNGIVSGPEGQATIAVDVAALSDSASRAMPAAWMLPGDGYAYIYRCGSQIGSGYDPCIVGRAPTASLTSLGAYRYYVAGKGYVGAYEDGTAVTEGAPAFSISWNTYLGAYVQLYIEPFAPSISVRTASAPEGPFSSKVDVWPCSLPADDPHAYCYAAFAHEQFDPANGQKVAVTYSTNSTDFDSMIRHPNVYWPRLVTIDLASALGQTRRSAEP